MNLSLFHLLNQPCSRTATIQAIVFFTVASGSIITTASAQEVPVVVNQQTGAQVDFIRPYWNANIDIANRQIACDHFEFNFDTAVYEVSTSTPQHERGVILTHSPLVKDAEGNASSSIVESTFTSGNTILTTWIVLDGVYKGDAAFNSKEYLELVTYDTTTAEITTGSTENAVRVWHNTGNQRRSSYSVCYALDNRPLVPTGSTEIGNNDLPALDELNDFTFQFPQPLNADTDIPVIIRRDTGEQVQFSRGEWAYNEQLALNFMACDAYHWNASYQGYTPVPEFGYHIGSQRQFSTSFFAYFDDGFVSTNTFWITDLGSYQNPVRAPVESFQLFAGDPFMELTDYGFNIWYPELSYDNYQRCTITSPKRVLPLQAGSCDYSDADQYDGWGWNAVTQQGCPPENNDANNATGEDNANQQTNTDNSTSNDQPGNDNSNESTHTIGDDTTVHSSDGDNGTVETGTTDDSSDTTGNSEPGSGAEQSNNVDTAEAQTSGSGAADKFLLLFLIGCVCRRKSKIEC